MKFYVYISDAKVDMLFPQVPHDIKKKVATEFKTDFKLFGASRKTEVETDENRVSRLEAVVEFIQKYSDIGTADEPGSYFADTLDLRWGECTPSVIYFGGQTKKTSIGLGGSMKHVLGKAGSDMPFSGSLTPFLLNALSENLPVQALETVTPLAERPDADQLARRAVEMANENMKGPAQPLEFLAKRLQHWIDPESRAHGKHAGISSVLLGSPLYVAMVD